MRFRNKYMINDEPILIVGLGNPGSEYTNTRHNAGFMTLDRWCQVHGTSMTQTKFQGIYGSMRLSGKLIHLLKPQTFMNLSGKSVQACLAFFHISHANMLVIHDELDLPMGDVRCKFGGSSGGHNGLKSIVSLTGCADFCRMRMGIGRPPFPDVIHYVLGNIPASEQEAWDKSVEIGCKALDTFVVRGLTAAMNDCNGLFRAKKKEEISSGIT